MALFTPLINGVGYSYVDIICTIMAVPISGITAIEYDDDQKIEDKHAAGPYVNERNFGPISTKGSITLTMAQVEVLTNIAIGRRLQNIPEFDITVTYLNPSNVTVTHTLRKCRIKNNGRSTKTGELGIECKLELAIAIIDW